MAAHNSGGIVIAQVERIAERGIAQPAPGEDPRHAGRLRGGGREARAPLADLRHAVQPGLRRRDPRARRLAAADGDERAQDHRAPRRARAEAQQRGQPRHRHARGRRRRGQRRKDHRPDDADRRARRDRRHSGQRPELRRGDQHPGRDRPALPVRLLRRRRARRGVPRPGAGRPARQPQRQQVRAAAGRRRRLHQHQPERQEGGVRRHLQRRRTAGRRRATAACTSCAKATARKFVERGRAPSPSAANTRAQRGQPVLYVTERCVFRLRRTGWS